MFNIIDFDRAVRGHYAWYTSVDQDPLYQHYLDDLHSRRYVKFDSGWYAYTEEQIGQTMCNYANEDEPLCNEIDLSEVL